MILHCCNFMASLSQIPDEDYEEIHSVPAIQKVKELSFVKEDTVSEHDCAAEPPTGQNDDHLVSMLRYALSVHPISSCKSSEQSYSSAITAVGSSLGSVSEDHIEVNLIEEIREELTAPDCQYELEISGEQQRGRGRDNYLEKPRILSRDNQSNSITEQDSRDEKRYQLEVKSMEEENNYSYRINPSLSDLTAEYTEVKTAEVKHGTISSAAEISVRTGPPVSSKRADATKDYLQLSVASPRKKCLEQIVGMQPASLGVISSTDGELFEAAICDSLYLNFQKMRESRMKKVARENRMEKVVRENRMEKVVGSKAGPVKKAPKPKGDDIFIRLYNQSRQLTKECVDEELLKKAKIPNANAVHLRLYEDSIQRQNERLVRNEASKNSGRSSDKAKSELSSSNKVHSRLYNMSTKRQNEGKKMRLRARDKDSQQVNKKVVATAPSPAQLRLYNSAKKAQAEEKLNISLEAEKENRAVKKKKANPTQLRLYEQSKKFRIEGKELRKRLENRNNNNDDTAVAVSSIIEPNPAQIRLFDLSRKKHEEAKTRRTRELEDKTEALFTKAAVSIKPNKTQIRLYEISKGLQIEGKQRRKEMSL